jgi:hypothetical protein
MQSRTVCVCTVPTKVTERVISDDLDFLISKAVNPEKADYAGESWQGA